MKGPIFLVVLVLCTFEFISSGSIHKGSITGSSSHNPLLSFARLASNKRHFDATAVIVARDGEERDGLQFMITNKMRRALEDDLGYLPEEVDTMEPQIAAVVIERGLTRPANGMPESWRRPGGSSRKGNGQRERGREGDSSDEYGGEEGTSKLSEIRNNLSRLFGDASSKLKVAARRFLPAALSLVVGIYLIPLLSDVVRSELPKLHKLTKFKSPIPMPPKLPISSAPKKQPVQSQPIQQSIVRKAKESTSKLTIPSSSSSTESDVMRGTEKSRKSSKNLLFLGIPRINFGRACAVKSSSQPHSTNLPTSLPTSSSPTSSLPSPPPSSPASSSSSSSSSTSPSSSGSSASSSSSSTSTHTSSSFSNSIRRDGSSISNSNSNSNSISSSDVIDIDMDIFEDIQKLNPLEEISLRIQKFFINTKYNI